MKKDTIFKEKADTGSFVFDQRVVSVFDDMVGRSVPGYQTIQLLVADLTVSFSKGNQIYDLGCSTGATICAIDARASSTLSITGVDSSSEMLEECKRKTETLVRSKTNFHCLDFINSDPFIDGVADVVILNLSLQFVRPIYRKEFIQRCFENIRSGGALILVEKTVEENKMLNNLYIEYYHRFKREMGYSEMEISSKREALENVLIPYQREENLSLLRDSGFSHVAPFFQWFNFSGFLAIK